MLAKEAARSENMQYLFDRILKASYNIKQKRKPKKNGKPSGQRPTKRQPLDNTFLQSRID